MMRVSDSDLTSESAGIAFEQLFDIEEIQRLQDEFAEAVSVASIITQPDGTPITRPSHFCKLCSEIIRASEKGRINCQHSDAVIGSPISAGPTVQTCLSGGLWDAGAAITVGGQHIANWLIGQVRDPKHPPETLKHYAESIGADADAAEAAFLDVPAMPREQFEKVAQMLFTLATQLSETAYQNLQLKRAIAERKKVEACLLESEAYNKALFAHSHTALAVIDASRLRFVDCNASALRLFELPSREAALGLTPVDLSPPYQYDGRDSQTAARAYVDETLKNGSCLFEWRHRRPNGEEWDAEVHLMSLQFGDKTLLQFSLHDISERRRAEITLRSVMEAANDAIVVIDPNGNITYWNRAAHQILGYSTKQALGRNLHEMIVPQRYLAAHQRGFQAFRHSGQGAAIDRTLELQACRSDGQEISVEVSLASVKQGNGWHAIGIIRDITARKQADEQLRLAAKVFSTAREGIVITDQDSTILQVNDAFSEITGYRRDEVIGQNFKRFSASQSETPLIFPLWHELAEKEYWHGEIRSRRKNGDSFSALLTVTGVHEGQGSVQHYIGLFSDITMLKAQQSQLENMAHFDILTSLPNRVLLADRLHQAMSQATRRGKRLAVAYLDLDGFKEVNDAHGHAVGDQLLMAIARSMSKSLREGDTLARIGGDEFVAVLLDIEEAGACTTLLGRLLAAAAHPVQIGKDQLQVSASIGVAFYPQEDEVDADQLLRQADQAMYQAKLSGKNRFHLFDQAHDRQIRGAHESMEHIRRALSAREFVLYYQPKVNMRTGAVIGAEALIRWRHPVKGVLPPSAFLPDIESTPLAIDIGEWVFHEALGQLKRWQDAGLQMPVSINVGAHQLQQPDFVERVRCILEAHPEVRPRQLMLEIVETSALEDLAHVHAVIEQCRTMGMRFALDDFGTGYSSLTYLKRLPVYKLKIDQSFVRDMLDDPDDLSILQGILGLATAFRREVIAEGVETDAHGELLLRLGCELAQGYGIARPMPACEIPAWVALWRPAATWLDRPPAAPEDFPLLFGATEHRAWEAALEAYLTGERTLPPSLDAGHCRLGQWLLSGGKLRHAAHPAFRAMENLHVRLHEFASECCLRRRAGHLPEPTEIATLRDLQKEMLNESRLLLDSQHPPGPSRLE